MKRDGQLFRYLRDMLVKSKSIPGFSYRDLSPQGEHHTRPIISAVGIF